MIRELEQLLEQLPPHFEGASVISLSSGLGHFNYATPTRIPQLPIDEHSQFYIGSVSKHMTAYLLLISLEQSYTDRDIETLLTVPLHEIFPSFSVLKQLNRDWIQHITLLDLLTHRSGLSDYLDAYGDGLTVPQALNEPIDAIRLLQSISFDSQKKHFYSNSNYLLVAKIIEELNQDTLDHVFEKMIKVPAQMNSSFLPVLGNYFDFKKCKSYERLVPNLNNKVFIDMANAMGAGSLISTVSDLQRWGAYLFQKAPKNLVGIMLRDYGKDPDGDNIHLGLNTMASCLGPLIGHQGGIDSYSSFFAYAPKQDTLLIMLSNSHHDANLLMETISTWLSPRPKPNQADLKLPMYTDQLSGERLSLRPMFPSDLVLQESFTDKDNMKYWAAGPASNTQEAQKRIVRLAANNLKGQQTTAWSIITHAGIAGCFFAWPSQDPNKQEVELAYVIEPRFAGRGLATQAGHLILHSYKTRDFEGTMVATAHPDNKASQAVLEKLGLKPDPERQNVFVTAYNAPRNYYQRSFT